MAYSETKIVIGGIAHIPVLIFIANLIKGKFEVKKETLVKEDPVKVIEAKEILVKEDKANAIKKLSNKLDNIEEKADEVFEKVKNKKKDKKKKKKKDMKRD